MPFRKSKDDIQGMLQHSWGARLGAFRSTKRLQHKEFIVSQDERFSVGCLDKSTYHLVVRPEGT